MKKFLSLMLALAMVFTLVACGDNSPATDTPANETEQTEGFKGTVTVGMCCPLSGSVGFIGIMMMNSAQVEVDKLNANGGVLGYEVKLVTIDDESTPSKSLDVTRQLIEQEKCVMLIGPAFTTNALAVKSLVNDSEILQILPNATGTGVLDDAPYTYRNSETDEMRYQACVNLMAKRGETKVAIMTMNDATGEQAQELIPPMVEAAGLEYVGAQIFSDGDTDLTAYMMKLKNAGADAVIIANGNSTYCARVATAADVLGWDISLYGGSGLQGVSYPQLAGDAAIGTTFVLNYSGEQAKEDYSNMPAGYAEHVQSVIAKYGTLDQGEGISVMNGTCLPADSIVLWAKAVEAAGSFDTKDVCKALDSGDVFIAAEESPSAYFVKPNADTHECVTAEALYAYYWDKNDAGEWYFHPVEM